VVVFRHVEREGLGEIAAALARAGLRTRTVDVWKRGARFPPLPAVRALVVMGGPMGVYERERFPFLRREIAFVRRALRAGLPVLGVCLGSQLMAAALGRRVFPNKRKEVGWHPVTRTSAARRDPVFEHMPDRAAVFQWHGDTFDLPRGAVLLARSSRCRNQAFRWGENAYAVQFHPEMDAALVRRWMREPGARAEIAAAEGPRAFDAILRDTPRRLRALRPWGDRLFDAFVRLI
jgi:GMP synthase (glutamine-hydrolysing)